MFDLASRWILLGVMAAALGCEARPMCPTPPPFGPPERIAVGEFPLDVAAGDVNGDGIVDLVSADERAGTLSVLLAQGDGHFKAAPSGAVPVKAHMLALADLNGDQRLDIVATHHDSAGVFVALGDGSGGFSLAPASPFPAHGGVPHNHGLAVGDVSGDGLPDVITSNQIDKSVSVLVTDGMGGLIPAASSPIRLQGEPYVLRLGDISGDGRLDIVVPVLSGHVAVLRGDGKGGFEHAPGSPYQTVERPYAAIVADLNADARLDVLVAHDDTDQATLLLGTGKGELAPAAGSPFHLGARVFIMGAADFDADGSVDIVGGAGDRLLMLRPTKGQSLSNACRSDLAPIEQSWNLVLADLNGDGRADLVAPDAKANSLMIWRSASP